MSRYGLLSAGLLLLVLCYSVESCVQRNVQAQVPETLQAGYVISKVNLGRCGTRHLFLTSSDPDFFVDTDGTILTDHATTIPGNGKSFWVVVQDQRGHKWRVNVNLYPTDEVSEKSSNAVLKRSKRRWSPPPFSIFENDPGPFPKEVEWIASDSSVNYTVYYKIDGPGVTEEPVGVFSVTPEGLVKVHKAVDREQYSKIVFSAHVHNRYSHVETDLPLPLTVIVQDVNDNAPQFSSSLNFRVAEQSSAGTFVGQVNATDKDEPSTPHTNIKFTIRNGTELFSINPWSGVISTRTATLDREIQETYFLQLEIRDMGGAPGGLFSLGTVTITLTDINDNPPTFRQTAYKAQVSENQADVLVLRIPVDDKDLQKTPNWNAVFEITKGNESGNFFIKTDPNTNEGLLYVTKPLDREKQDKVNLEIMARNQPPLVGTTDTWKRIPVELTVADVDEGPEFSAPILRLKVKENVANGTVIGTYTAIDPETKSSKGIKYYKLTDPGSWINVLDSTGELRTAKTIDRESPLVYNNTYNITVKAVDESQKSATGTVVILIEDVNDNFPLITKPDLVVCSKDGKPSSTLVEAADLDQTPYAGPFTFKLGKAADGKWKLRDTTASSVVLEQVGDVPNGVYHVPLLVTDLQGYGEEQTVNVRVCDCTSDGVCKAPSISSRLGVWAILAMLLGLLLLLLLCLLFVLVCTTKGEKLRMADDDDGVGGMLLKSNTEAPGEEVKDSALLAIPGSGGDIADIKGATMDHKIILGAAGGGFGQHGMYQGNTQGFMTMQSTMSSGQFGGGLYGNSFYNKYSDGSNLDTWRTNEIYLDNKLMYFAVEEDDRFAPDLLKPYGYEGVGSPAGSVGCCSVISEQETLDFLDSLGPKFKTLADVCVNKKERSEQ